MCLLVRKVVSKTNYYIGDLHFGCTNKYENRTLETDKHIIENWNHVVHQNDDVCEWKSASDGEFIQIPHTKRLYSNEPSMQNVYCNTCGKKIKVVN